MRNYLVENLIKNLAMIILLLLLYPLIETYCRSIPNKDIVKILTVVGLILAGSVAGTFAFSYEKTHMDNRLERWIGHLTTFGLNFGIGILFVITLRCLSIELLDWENPIFLAMFIVYISIILYDIWDSLIWRPRMHNRG